MPLILRMKRLSLRKTQASSPRLTLWVPIILTLALSLLWLGLLALLHR
jgi:hypothetical protein